MGSLVHLQRVLGNRQVARALQASGRSRPRGVSGTVRRLVNGSTAGVIHRQLTAEEQNVDLASEQLRDDSRLQKAFDNAPAMHFGERGDAVKKVQQALVDLGFEMPVSTQQGAEEPDGIFGPETFRTIKAFQHMQGVTKDGIVGRQTLGELDGRLTGLVATGTPAPFTVAPGGPVAVSTADRSPQLFEACAEGFGRFHWEVDWVTNARNGYIVQEVKSAQQGDFCDGTPDSGVAPVTPVFWEAWRVQQDGTVHPPPGTDTWQVPVHPAHRGTWGLSGKVFFVAQLDPQAGFRTGNVDAPQSGSLYATAVQPGNLGPVLFSREAAGRWECCGDTNVHEPVGNATGGAPSEAPLESEVLK
jgi:peptidoglycan hydrolase-like protein with peptidoglycan-binding domain